VRSPSVLRPSITIRHTNTMVVCSRARARAQNAAVNGQKKTSHMPRHGDMAIVACHFFAICHGQWLELESPVRPSLVIRFFLLWSHLISAKISISISQADFGGWMWRCSARGYYVVTTRLVLVQPFSCQQIVSETSFTGESQGELTTLAFHGQRSLLCAKGVVPPIGCVAQLNPPRHQSPYEPAFQRPCRALAAVDVPRVESRRPPAHAVRTPAGLEVVGLADVPIARWAMRVRDCG
jgi:hypothetical protein